MNKNEIAHTLRECSREIGQLRRRNEILDAQMEVVRIFGRATAAVGGVMMGASPCPAYAADKLAVMLEDEAHGEELAEAARNKEGSEAATE